MPPDENLEIPELTPDWFAAAIKPHRRGTKRAVFVDEAIARHFESDEEIEKALGALVEAAAHVRKAG